MDARIRNSLLTALLLTVPGVAPAQSADSLPPGVTKEMVAKGKNIFTGTGLCLACHGMEAKGGIGPDLTDQTWLHGDGSYEAIVKLIATGVTTEESKTGQIMPPKGGSTISPEEVKIVAAYVWKLSRK